jgi:type VI secretion system protein ImpH
LLGQGAIAGQSVPDRQSKFRLVIGPLSLNAYLRLTPAGTPQGSDLAALIEMVRAFIGFEYVWEVQLRVQRPEVQTAQLGGTQQLGWSTWLEHNAQHTQAIEGLVMEPEAYAKH